MVAFVLFMAATVAFADQLIKILVVNQLKPIGEVTAIPYLLDLVYVENKGAAFGILSEQRWIFLVISIVMIAMIVLFLVKYKPESKLFQGAMILILGGGIGNLIDRVCYGYVVDYLKLSFFPPVCNLADYCIVIGSAIFIIYLIFFSNFFESDKKSKNKSLKVVDAAEKSEQ